MGAAGRGGGRIRFSALLLMVIATFGMACYGSGDTPSRLAAMLGIPLFAATLLRAWPVAAVACGSVSALVLMVEAITPGGLSRMSGLAAGFLPFALLNSLGAPWSPILVFLLCPCFAYYRRWILRDGNIRPAGASTGTRDRYTRDIDGGRRDPRR